MDSFFISIALATIIFSVLQTIWFVLELTIEVCRDDLQFAAKTFASGLISSAIGYYMDGQITIEVILWGLFGLALYLSYRYIFNPP